MAQNDQGSPVGGGGKHTGVSGLVLPWERHRAGQTRQEREGVHLERVRPVRPRSRQGQSHPVVWQDGQTFLRRRWAHASGSTIVVGAPRAKEGDVEKGSANVFHLGDVP